MSDKSDNRGPDAAGSSTSTSRSVPDEAQVSRLLAHRDGELVEVDPTEPGVEPDADPAARAWLGEMRDLKVALNQLPAVAPPESSWDAVVERSQQRPARSGLFRFPAATAAAVFVAAAAGIGLWNPLQDPRPEQTIALAASDITIVEPMREPVTDLITQSVALETQVRNSGWPLDDAAPAVLAYRIADIDAELDGLLDAPTVDALRREQLWRQRVQLLRTLYELQRTPLPEQTLRVAYNGTVMAY